MLNGIHLVHYFILYYAKKGYTFIMKKYIIVFLIFSAIFGMAKGLKNKRWLEYNHIVKDRVLKLTWQDTRIVRLRKRTWKDAQKYCKRLKLSRKRNWRLPTMYELLTIVDYKRETPAINDIFQYVEANGYYWTTDDVVNDEEYAWYVSFKKGNTYGFTKAKKAYVRCVRDNKRKNR